MSDSIIERLRHHAKDERNTAFARSTMREAEGHIERLSNDLFDALDCKNGTGPTALSLVVDERDSLRDELARMTAQRDAILMQARIWSGEAKAQKATVDAVSEILGGVPNWGPIAQGVEQLRAELAASREREARMRILIAEIAAEAHDYEKRSGKKVNGGWLQRADAALAEGAQG